MKEVSAREQYRLEQQEQARQDVLDNAGQNHDYFIGNAANKKIKQRAECPIYREELEIA